MSEYQDLLMNEYAKQYATNWFQMNEGSGTTLNDSKGTAIGTINGATWRQDGGLSFNGNSSFVQFNNKFPTGVFSFSLIGAFRASVNNSRIIATANASNSSPSSGFFLVINNGKLGFWQPSLGTIIGIKTITDNMIHLIKFVSDGQKIKIFINGTLDIEAPKIFNGHSYNTVLGKDTNTNSLYSDMDIYHFSVFDGVNLEDKNINKSLILHDGEYKNREEGSTYNDGNAVPILTSSTGDGVIIDQSTSFNPAYDGWRAFDGVVADSNKWMSVGGFPQWLSINFTATKKRIVKYGLSAPDASQIVNRWRFQGSLDNSSWDDLDIVENTPLSINETTYFTIDNPNDYYYYRFYVEGAQTGNYATFSEVKLFEEETIATPAHWQTVSYTIPTATQFLEQGMDNLSPLLDRTVTELEPMTMTDKSEILGEGEVGKVFKKTIDLKKYFDIRNIRTEVK